MSVELPQRDDYRQLFLDNTPMLDVRAPVEYEQGSFPITCNVPIINNDERQAIGLCYKKQGQSNAIELGHQLVKGDIKSQRVNDWVDFVRQHNKGALFCFRGGMRSKITQRWIYDQSGIIYPRVKGGYKAMRRFLLNELETSVTEIDFTLLSGRTGVGKTNLLQTLTQYVDLVGIYRHYGSAFGKMVQQQPSQIDVENELSITFMKHRDQQHNRLVLEDESASIGSRRIPNSVLTKMAASSVVVLESPFEDRVELIYQQYVVNSRQQHQARHGIESGTERWADNLRHALLRIQRRLGGARFVEVKAMMDMALIKPYEPAIEEHKAWILFLLKEYYDAMYDYQLEKKAHRILFKGDEQAVKAYLTQRAF